MNFHPSQLICVLAFLLSAVHDSVQYCSKFGRHLLQHQCVLTPESTEGPFYFPVNLLRKDIRENKQGVPFKLRMTFTDVNTCEPLKNVTVDLWQADANGQYSGYVDHVPSTAQHTAPVDSSTFLRGIQLTDKDGKAEFMTIFPGMYNPRTTHIHISSHLGGKTIHTGQLYFSNNLIKRINRMYPYNNTKDRQILNEDDFLFKRYDGPKSLVTKIKTSGGKRISNGLVGEIIIGLDPNMESKTALHGKG